jgi:hypothetical protein
MKIPALVLGATAFFLLPLPSQRLFAQQAPQQPDDPGPVLSPAFQQQPVDPQASQSQANQPQGYLKKPSPYHYAQPQSQPQTDSPPDTIVPKPPQNQAPSARPQAQTLTLKPPQTHSSVKVPQAQASAKPPQTHATPKLTLTPPNTEIAQASPADPQVQAPQPEPQYQPQPGYQQQPQPGYQYAQPNYAPQPQPSYPTPQPQYAQPQPPPQQGYNQPQPNYAQPDPSQPQYAQSGPDDDRSQPNYAPAPALSAPQIEQLVAPIALYPDSLLAQILAASTYPAQIAAADQWLRQMGPASPDQIAAGANAQTSWDPSVKSLTAFPQVLQMLDGNLQWTTSLGNAYYNQPQDVLSTVQSLRQRAEQAGNLQNTPQEQVTQNQGYIALAPPNPEVVYVPAYNPWAVYGAPISPYPGFSLFGALGSFFGVGLHYGLGFGVAAFEHTPFGLLAWGLDWLANSILFHHANYFSHSNSVHDWGLAHGGPRAFRGGASMARGGGNGYHHEAIPIHSGEGRPGQESGQGFNHGESGLNRGDSFARREGSFDGRNQQGPMHGYPGNGYPGSNGFTHPAMPGQQAYNRMPESRPQQFESRAQPYQAHPQQAYGAPNQFRSQSDPYRGQSYAQTQPYGQNGARPGYGYGAQVRPGESYAARPGMGYSSPQPYRAPTPNFSHGNSYDRPGPAYAGNYGTPQRGNEFRSSGGHAESFGGSSHASRSYSKPPSFHEKAPRGGGGHSGGGHSGGGGGHHHR